MTAGAQVKLKQRNKDLEGLLTALLSPAFPGIVVEAGFSERWERPCVSFSWEGFSGLLPEERFQRLTAAIPEDFRDAHLDGFAWVELAPGEKLEDVLALPRSEDVAPREPQIIQDLQRSGFFEAIGKRLGKSPQESCPGNFTHTAAVLGESDASEDRIRDTKLVFIRHGAFCDCQVLQTVGPKLMEKHT